MFLTSRSKKVSHTGGDSLVAAEEIGEVSLEKGDAKNVNVSDADDDNEEPEEDDDDMEDGEEIIDRLRGQIERMEGERMQLATMNNDLQKRAVLLIQRERRCKVKRRERVSPIVKLPTARVETMLREATTN